MKKILFITGTRADYGKLKTLMKHVDESDDFECYIFVCGMHLLEKYGSTYTEIERDNYKHVYVAHGLPIESRMDINCGNTILQLSGYVAHLKPDLIVVHGDRHDALSGALVGALNNIFVAHIEGGELSGTIDESLRHSISKLSHFHFVANNEAEKRLNRMGESASNIFVIGSPDIDIMLSRSTTPFAEIKKHYEIEYDKYGILMYHSVTTDITTLESRVTSFVDAMIESCRDCIVIYPNNDTGTDVIMHAYRKFKNNPHFRLFPSLRFEYFLELLRNADFIAGNSSAGIREACVYGIPAIDIGNRQEGRYSLSLIPNIQHVDGNKDEILSALNNIDKYRISSSCYGKGKSAELFMQEIRKESFWNSDIQKHFVDSEDF